MFLFGIHWSLKPNTIIFEKSAIIEWLNCNSKTVLNMQRILYIRVSQSICIWQVKWGKPSLLLAFVKQYAFWPHLHKEMPLFKLRLWFNTHFKCAITIQNECSSSFGFQHTHFEFYFQDILSNPFFLSTK